MQRVARCENAREVSDRDAGPTPDTGRNSGLADTNAAANPKVAFAADLPTEQVRDLGPRRDARRAEAGSSEQSHDARPVWAERLEQFEHPGIIGASLAREREADNARKVPVTDRDRVGIATHDVRDGRRSPPTDARDGDQRALERTTPEHRGPLEPSDLPSGEDERRAAPGLDAEAAPLVIAERGDPIGVRRQ